MRLGLVHINMGSMSRPDALVEAAQAAEAAGFDSVWAGEHIVLPDPQVPPSPMRPQDPALDSLLALTWAAAHTTTIRLATGIVILPQRNPVVLAKQVATLDVLSGGRLILGIGAGYLEAEFRAIWANFPERGAGIVRGVVPDQNVGCKPRCQQTARTCPRPHTQRITQASTASMT